MFGFHPRIVLNFLFLFFRLLVLSENTMTWFLFPSRDLDDQIILWSNYYEDEHSQGCFKCIWKLYAP